MMKQNKILDLIKFLFSLFSKKGPAPGVDLVDLIEPSKIKNPVIEVIEEDDMTDEIFTKESLLSMMKTADPNDVEYYLDALNKVLPEYNINTKLRACHFIAQVAHESGCLKYKKENLNYSAEALRRVFGKYFKNDGIALDYARKPSMIGSRVYADRMGNGDEDSFDGFRYSGRGLIQLTGKGNYEQCGKALKIDLVKNPELINSDAEICVRVACWFWDSRDLNLIADEDDLHSITKKINGGYNGIEHRAELLEKAKVALHLN